MTNATQAPDQVETKGAAEDYADDYGRICSALSSDLATAFENLIADVANECYDRATAEVLGGMVIEGVVVLPTIADRDLRIEVSPRTKTTHNPAFDDCGCRWGRSAWEEGLAREARDGVSEGYVSLQNGELLHGWLLQLDGPDPLFAVGQLLNHFSDHVMPVTDFEAIAAQHNWSNPVVMQEFASMMDYTWGKITVANRFDEIATGITDPAELPAQFRGRIRISLVT